MDKGSVRLPQDAWDTAGAQTTVGDPYQLSITTLAGNEVHGPATQSFTIAKGSLSGSIYYNSYNSKLASGGISDLTGQIGDLVGISGLGGISIGMGAVLRLQPGKDAELFARTGSCVGCHSLSANGERLIVAELAGGAPGGFGGASSGPVYAITPQTTPDPMPLTSGPATSFGGLTPDGRYYLSSGAQAGFGPELAGGMGTPAANAILYETDTGMTMDSGIPPSAMMPTFSPDGTLLVFNDYTANNGRSLTLMDFDLQSGKATNPRVVYTHDSKALGWPFLLPDNRGIVFSATDSTSFSGEGSMIVAPIGGGPYSEVLFLDLQSGEAQVLARAMGYASPDAAASKTSYLPFGAEELGQAYYPTVSPVAAGGYFWIFFDSIRHYGNTGLRRQIWGTAIAIPQSSEFNSYAPDPSAPAFYLDGQEIDTANHRAFTVLNPCKQDGDSCESGVDCCGGFCTNGVCGYEMPRCSEVGEACKTAADCCDSGIQCVAGFCSVVLN